MLRVGSDPADVVRDVGKFFVSESFRVCLRRTHERARNTLMNYDRDERKNGTSMKIFSGSSEHKVCSAISILLEREITLQRAVFGIAAKYRGILAYPPALPAKKRRPYFAALGC